MVSQCKGRSRQKRFKQLSLLNVISAKKNGTKGESSSDDGGLKRSCSEPTALNFRPSSADPQMRIYRTQNDLNDLYLIDSKTCERVCPNEVLHRIDNEVFSGYMLALIPTSENKTLFAGKKRMIELQLQVKFKKIPKEQIHIGCELGGALKIGICQRTLLKGILNVIERRNPNFHYNLSSAGHGGDTETSELPEKPYLSMPFETSLNALVITKDGEMPPALGESLDMERSRLSIGDIDYNTSDTYTFALWNGYVDLLKWRCRNIAPVQPFPLQSVIGDQVFTLNFYTRGGSKGTSKRTRNVDSFMRFEFGHGEKSKVGPSRKVWSQSNARSEIQVPGRCGIEQERDDVENCDSNKVSYYLPDSYWMCWAPYS